MNKCKQGIVILILILIVLPSCATILSGTRQTVRLNSSPSGANVIINGKLYGQITPCAVELERKVKPGEFNKRNEYHYLFTKEGYSNTEYIDYRKINKKIYWACVIYPFLIFSIPIDYISGAAFQYNDNLMVSLSPERNNPTYVDNNEISKISELDKLPPVIKIYSPDINRGFKQTISDEILNISGMVSDESGIFEIIINGIPVKFEFDGSFKADIPLEIGNNKITLVAKDKKMNAASESFYIEREVAKEISVIENAEVNLKGQYYALIIGVEDYADPTFNDLEEPLKDAQNLENTLTVHYIFNQQNIHILKNPGRDEITQALEKYFNELTPNDNLLIFYAGHGYWDEKFKQGYWLPSDAKYNNRGTWLANSTIRDYMRAIPCKHSLLITDACFAGGIFKSREAFPDASKAINELYQLPSRKAMTSGALKQVPDKSVFLEYLIKRLETNEQKYLPAEQLFSSFKMAVINNSSEDQVPQFGEVKETGDEGGDFIFIRK